MRHILFLAALWLLSAPAQAGITVQPWGVTADDARPANLYRLSNAHGMAVTISNYGGVIVSLTAPDRKNHFANVVQGFDTLAGYTSADYIAANGHYGSIIGRFANRIKGARITLDGKVYHLDPDKNGDLDQGGRMAYFRQVWDATTKPGGEPRLILHHIDPDGYMGFPGRVDVTVTYTLTRDNRLRIDYRATADKKTVINLINHSYFSLAGPGPGTIDKESLQLFADAYTPISEGKVPTGEIRPVTGTDFDFTNPTVIGPRFASHDPQMAQGRTGSQLCDPRHAGQPAHRRPALRSRFGPDPGSVDDPARHAGLQRQQCAAGGRQGQGLGTAWRDLVPDPALSGLAQSSEFSLDRTGAGERVSRSDGIPLPRDEGLNDEIDAERRFPATAAGFGGTSWRGTWERISARLGGGGGKRRRAPRGLSCSGGGQPLFFWEGSTLTFPAGYRLSCVLGWAD